MMPIRDPSLPDAPPKHLIGFLARVYVGGASDLLIGS